MPINSKRKGKNGELEVARILREHGFDARRTQQYCGTEGTADVTGLSGYHLEVKRNERLNIEEAMLQSINDAREGETPVVVHRKNNKKWLVTMSLEDFLNIVERQKGDE